MTVAADDARRTGHPRLAMVVAVVTWVVTLASVVLRVAARVPMDPDLLFFVVDAMVGVVYGTVGAVILARRSHPVGWLVALAGAGGALAALGSAWGTYQSGHPTLPALPVLTATVSWAWVPGTLALFLVVPWLVRDSRLSGGAWAGVVAGSLLTLALTAQRLFVPMADNTALLAVVVVLGLVTAAATGWRYRHGPVRERPGLGLLTVGTALMALSFVPLLLVDSPPEMIFAVPLTHLACQALFPVALLVTVLRNRLWGIDLAVSRAAVAGLLTLGLALVYALVVLAATVVVGGGAVAQVIATVGVAVAVQPVHAWLGRRVHALVYGESSSRAALRVGSQLSGGTGTEELLDGLTAAVAEALRLESVTVVGDEHTAQWGTPTSTPARRTLEHAGRSIGSLAVTVRPGERLDARTGESLDHLLPVVAAGLALVQGAADLERARDAATRARLAERRLIRRELHDGIGPWLSGLRLGLQGARNTLTRDPAAADAILDALQAEVEQRVQDVRLLSRSLLPPLLDEEGLGPALRELARRSSEGGFDVRMQLDDPADLDPRLRAAAYAIVSEAVVNASRYSGAEGCAVSVSVQDAALVVTVLDLGSGIPVGAPSGVGLRSMRERADELGGVVTVEPHAPGGTRVHAILPLDPVLVRSRS
ncbi:sensor histidine kinase [Cellulomonas humilata]|uniref:histidine kinase n=1 Tax=Cellulomonas humilata TaxID=144055 RepID=A0ABU0EG62_9CELL|nr:histidine kinase [Cellulomonas humilata]MDQ0374268.1 signal transduction histidine kinase [Cellulomonas humilata]